MTDQELPAADAQKPSGKAIASLVLGVGSLLLSCLLGPLTLPFALAGLVLGFMSLKTAGRGLAIGGMITSGIALIFGLVSIVILSGLIMFGSSASDYGPGDFEYLYPEDASSEDWEDF
jgi:hypothetical protein